MDKLRIVPLSEFLSPYRIEHIVQNDISYQQVTISNDGTISLRGSKLGAQIGRKRQFMIDLKNYPDTIMFTRQGLASGAIGIVPSHLDGCIATENMPMLAINTHMVNKGYVMKLIQSEYFNEKINNLKVVGSAQKSIHERDMLNMKIALPSITVQHEIYSFFQSIDVTINLLEKECRHQINLFKKLRHQLLQDAIQGKLTEQWRLKNPNITPAKELLQHIIAERIESEKLHRAKRKKKLQPISGNELTYTIPDNWIPCRLGDLIIMHYGKGLVKAQTQSKGKYPVYGSNGVVGFYHVGLTDKRAIIVGRKGSAGAMQIAPNGSWATDVAYYIEESKHLDFDYLTFLLRYLKLENLGKGLKPGLNRDEAYSLAVPLPPYKEQKAIVAKTKKLLNMCDLLQAKINENATNTEELVRAISREVFSHNQ